ncbi:hypothetical protein CesoFtcFv8_020307 [Champsocephalus esox]|uniref:Uncharacterized protein n=1 Tax=Champsocephalus esox TaxID=159716 RepID=A0AAN8BFL6_9TELE|nr:hypothetical protein CesoFtcFv8_020307 [Champsocephalus esox]
MMAPPRPPDTSEHWPSHRSTGRFIACWILRPGAEGSPCDRVLKGRCTPEEQLYVLVEEGEGAGVSERCGGH